MPFPYNKVKFKRTCFQRTHTTELNTPTLYVLEEQFWENTTFRESRSPQMPTSHLLSCCLSETGNVSMINVVKKELSDLKVFVYLHRVIFQFLYQVKKPVNVLLGSSLLNIQKKKKSTHFFKQHAEECAHTQHPLFPVRKRKMGPGRWISVSALLFRSSGCRILKINLGDNAASFWRSWKRHHKTRIAISRGW